MEVRTTLLEHGQPFSTAMYTIDPEGKRLRVSTEYMHGRQPHSMQVDEYVRKAGTGKGLEGTWQGVVTTIKGPLTYVLRLEDGALYYLDTMEGAASTAKLDGTPALFDDPHPDNVRWMNRWDGARKNVGGYLLNGKPQMQEILELSPDGRTLKKLGCRRSGQSLRAGQALRLPLPLRALHDDRRIPTNASYPSPPTWAAKNGVSGGQLPPVRLPLLIPEQERILRKESRWNTEHLHWEFR